MNGGSRPRVVLGVSGGIAAYKACELLRRLTESGHDVTVVPTAAALKFVGAATWEALSGKPVRDRRLRPTSTTSRTSGSARRPTWSSSPRPRPTCWRERRTAGPTTCSTATLLTARCPVVLAPAMHTEMWEHPATRDNVATLRERGVARPRPGVRPAHRRRHRPGPAARARGDLRGAPSTCSRRGAAGRPADLAGRRVVVSAPAAPASTSTRCASSATARSGKQGYALAARGGGPRRRRDARGGQRRAARPGRRARSCRVVVRARAARRRARRRRRAPTWS